MGAGTAQSIAGFTPQLQIEGAAGSTSSTSFIRNSADANSSNLLLGKTRGVTSGSFTSVANNDSVGLIQFCGADGSALIRAANIEAQVDGTPGTGNMPGRLIFRTTPSGSNTPTERMRLTSAGLLGLGTSSPSAKLTIADATTPYIRIERPGVTTWQIQNNQISVESGFSVNNITSSTTPFFIGESGRVGIGTTSPSYSLHVNGNATVQNNLFRVLNNALTAGMLVYPPGVSGTWGESTGFALASDGSSSPIGFFQGASERARIDSSGRLLVGTSSTATAGTADSALVQVKGATGGALDGRFALLRNEAATAIGSGENIGIITFGDSSGNEFARVTCTADADAGSGDYPGRLVFSTTADGASSPTERMRIQADGVLVKYGNTSSARIVPQTDNAGFIGQNDKRWEAIYAVNGTIQTSDEREKTEIQASQLGSDFIRALRPVSYKWKIGGYTSTYDDEGNETITPNPGVRIHYGFIAQEVKQACGDTDFGGWLQEDLSNPESMQSLRLHEFISPIVKALQEALDEIDTLKAKVATLESA